MRLFDHPYAALLERVAKPSRYTGGEYGVVRKDWKHVAARVCLAFPDVYDIGMSHLGYRILYETLNRDEALLAERCYAPWLDLWQELESRDLPLVSLESGRPLRDFDVVGFSLQFELTYTNVLGMLRLGGIPVRSEQRGEADPLVLVGGPAATHAEPLAPFFDAALIGDGEEATGEIARCWAEARRQGLPRHQRLVRLAGLDGVYVPTLYDCAEDPETGLLAVAGPREPGLARRVRRRAVVDLSAHPFPATGPVGGAEAVFDRVSVEVARGCTEGCRFCQAGMIYRPVRERPPDQLLDTVAQALCSSGQDEVSLAALSTADVSYISPLTLQLAQRTARDRVSLSVASLRAYGLSEPLLDAIGKVRSSGLTFAPEAGTQRLRDVINKNVSEQQLLDAAERVFARGFDRMKLYFIIGLPTETDDDVRGIVEVGHKALAVARRHGRRARVTLSVSTHVPKPHTPFQWCAMDRRDDITRKQQLLWDAVRGTRGLTLRVHDADTSWLEGVLARGDRRVAAALERASLGGARFDAWEDELQMDVWLAAFADAGIDPDRYLGALRPGAPTPWSHLDIGIDAAFLQREYQRALRGRPSPPCGKPVGQLLHHDTIDAARADRRPLICYDCGAACDLTELREARIRQLEALDADGSAAGAPTSPIGRKPPEHRRPPQSDSPPVRWRLAFAKTGPAALLGHLDLIRELSRVLRRAGVRAAYTAGYHPKPAMSFTPALALGVASLNEVVDVKLLDAPAAPQLVKQLNEVTYSGMWFTRAAALGPGDPAINAVLSAADYVLALDAEAVAERGGAEWLQARIVEFLAATTVPVTREGKRGRKELDARALVLDLGLGGDHEAALLREAGLVGAAVTVRVRVKLDRAGTLRPREMVESVTGEAGFPHLAVRSALLAATGSPLDIEVVRHASDGGR